MLDAFRIAPGGAANNSVRKIVSYLFELTGRRRFATCIRFYLFHDLLLLTEIRKTNLSFANRKPSTDSLLC